MGRTDRTPARRVAAALLGFGLLVLTAAPALAAHEPELADAAPRSEDPLVRGFLRVPRWVPPALGGLAAASGAAYLAWRIRRRS
jgi:hypothetical protein